MINVLENVGREETYFNTINTIFTMFIRNEPTSNIILKGENFSAIPLKPGISILLLFNTVFKVLAVAIR